MRFATRTSPIRRRYEKRVADTPHIQQIRKVRCTYVTVTRHVNRDVCVAYQEYELRIYGVPVTLLSYVPRMCDVCTAYRTCHVRATIFKYTCKNVASRRMRSMSYLCSRMYDVRMTYLSYPDTP